MAVEAARLGRGLSIAVLGSLLVTLAGCADVPSDIDPGADPAEFMPETPQGWSLDDCQEQQAGIVGAEAGWGCSWQDADDRHHAVEILRWKTSDEAREGGDKVYASGWTVYVAKGNFGFAGKGASHDSVVFLLSHSPVLDDAYIRANER